MKFFKYISLSMILTTALFSGCKEKENSFENPYDGGIAPLGIQIDRQQVPVPAVGIPGTLITFRATGLMPHKDKIEFLFNGEKAEIDKIDETGIKVKVPGRASSGVTAFVIDGQLVFGPNFTVSGFVKKDPTYKVVAGTNGPIFNIYEVAAGNLLLLGSFTNYDNKGVVKRINSIVRTFPDGTWDRSLLSGSATTGTLTSLGIVNGEYFLAGGFTGYAQRGGINNITKVSNQATIDTIGVETYTKKSIYVPKFNGGTDGSINDLYAVNNKLIGIGNFRYYVSRRYDQPTSKFKDSTVIDTIDMRQLARFNTNGTLDKTWRFDPNATGYGGAKGRGLAGGNGGISKAIMHTDGKIMLCGSFTKFDDQPAGYMVRLNADGTIDPTFNMTEGADYYVNYVSYNETTKKYLVTGVFKKINGVAVESMAMLNYDGSVDQSFVPKRFGGGYPGFTKQLKDGLCLVSGSFKTYDGVNRQGFLITTDKGEIAEGYNNVGNLLGTVLTAFETKSADNKRALVIGGSFFLFDNLTTNNLVKVTLE
ncbi:DUF5008 domain-containing protein [Pedobacter sp. B4-66]|uniref:DUF5008 domain-containing protein n=1 Tax=Pedobacter sp. B4-66 TaxID=2817280 RepID=UPI001BDA12FD|nr:DUF5008 domain-containing protein [Pedobacter sp. B4-66]